jgi:alpha-methylacyl-CoA racemase
MPHFPLSTLPLKDMQVVSLALNLPGPLAAARLHDLGATVIKIEPPAGDPLATWCPSWYEALNAKQQVLTLDLKQPASRQQMDKLLSQTDLLLTSMRPSALQRLDMSWEQLHERYPRLCQVAIVGYPPPDLELAGHDLSYQASLGLVEPPNMPRALIADMGGAQEAVNAALALLLARERGMGRGYTQVSLAEAAEWFAQPWLYGTTAPGGAFGGGLARYGLYQTQEGWIALAALEGHFWEQLKAELGFEAGEPQVEDLQRIFSERRAAEWETWGMERDIPLLAVRG